MSPQEGRLLDTEPSAGDTPATATGPTAADNRNARLGLVLFAIYLALYGGFVALNAFAPQRMGEPALAGINLAIVYGFGLILAALVLALVYMALCRPSDDPRDSER